MIRNHNGSNEGKTLFPGLFFTIVSKFINVSSTAYLYLISNFKKAGVKKAVLLET